MAGLPELRAHALQCLLLRDPVAKVDAIGAMAAAYSSDGWDLFASADIDAAGTIPGRPEHPLLVAPRLVGRRSMVTQEGRAMLVHALAHIEFNETKLSLVALWRFPVMPDA